MCKQRTVAAVAAVIGCVSSVPTKRKYKRKRYWVADILNQRHRNGFYFSTFPTLKLDDLRFKNYFRMNHTQFEELLQLIGPRISRQHVVREPIGAEQRLIICLKYLASGDSMVSMAHQYSVSQTAVCQIIPETCQAIWDALQPFELPQIDCAGWKRIANEMNAKWQFPNCIGAMDGKYVIIQSPQHSGSAYFNYKQSHSIVLLAICDANYRFIYIDIGAFGRQSDGGVFKNSLIGKKFADGQMDVPAGDEIYQRSEKYPYVLVADEAFPLTSYLMRPFPGRDGLSTEKKIFNYRLSRARRTIENAFGILAAQWRIYKKPILAKVENTEKMVLATLVLHNWLRKQNTNLLKPCSLGNEERSEESIVEDAWTQTVEPDNGALQPIASCSTHTFTRSSAAIREQLMGYFNEEGAVPWQFAKIYN